ncbi:hypothetical protein LCGC14_2941350, partial [marine sediment metagenome]
ELRLRADYMPSGTTAALNPERGKREVIEAAELMLKEPVIANNEIRRLAVFEVVLENLGPTWLSKKQTFLPSPEEMEQLRLKQQIEQFMTSAQLQKILDQIRRGESPEQISAQLSPQPGGGNGTARPVAPAR